jgi:UDP-N-acetyl-2-amino-2-deoxyglucuronate dehydrogenase
VHAGPLRTALVGCGKVSATHALAFSRLPGSEFVAVCSRGLDRAQALARRFGVRAYNDIRQMIEGEHVDVVSITTPHPQHAPAIEAAARAGAHVLCEKPLAVDLPSCDRAIDAARRAGVKLGVISQRRFYEPVLRLKQAIDEGRIGKPILAQVTVLGWRDEAYYRSDPWRGTWSGEGGGVMVSQCTHQLDLLLWFLGPVRHLYGEWANFTHPYIEVEDTAVALARFENGAIASVVLSNSQNPGLYGKVHVFGSSGASIGVQVESGSPFISGVTDKADPPFNDLWTIPGEEHLLDGWQREDRTRPINVMTHYHELQIADFLDAVAEDRPPAVTGEDGRAVVEFFTAVYLCQQHSRVVGFPLKAEEFTGVLHAASH